ncbi:Ycf66 family protein [[Phormidium] sp. ETS-05]|uniref:Ycf66 family protein n=1 Tax=[Phormidium] sp. ETS-05 TaxID=222819 RepID=UPI0018EECC75|nr:Ycf66 family protein [[Phormidium] sp. ETS-05]
MVNFSLNLASLVGIALAIGGVGLYFVRSVRPELSRDYDLFFAAVALLCGGILFFYGWRFDPIMQFGQILLGGSAIFFAFENIRLRGITTVQAKRQSAPIVDDRRPVSDVYRVDAELDEIEPYDERPVTRRIRGTQEPSRSRGDYYEDERRRPSSRSGYDGRSGATAERPDRPRRPSSPSARPSAPPYSEPEAETRTRRRRPPEDTSYEPTTQRTYRPPVEPPQPDFDDSEDTGSSDIYTDIYGDYPAKRRPSSDSDSSTTDYVDYQPIDEDEDEDGDEGDNSRNFDK